MNQCYKCKVLGCQIYKNFPIFHSTAIHIGVYRIPAWQPVIDHAFHILHPIAFVLFNNAFGKLIACSVPICIFRSCSRVSRILGIILLIFTALQTIRHSCVKHNNSIELKYNAFLLSSLGLHSA